MAIESTLDVPEVPRSLNEIRADIDLFRKQVHYCTVTKDVQGVAFYGTEYLHAVKELHRALKAS